MPIVEVELEDAEANRRAHPRTYSIPRREVREALPVGCSVKLVFRIPPGVESDYGAERMWCEVVARDAGGYTGALLSTPSTAGWLEPGVHVRFEARHVAGLEPDDRPTMAPLIGCSLAVLRAGAWPTRIVRVAPVHHLDSGWRVFADEGDHRVRAVTIGNFTRAWAVVDSVIDEREAGAWVWDADELEYRRTERLAPDVLAAANRGLGRVHAAAPPAKLTAIVTRRVLDEAPRGAQWLTPSPNHADDSGWCFFVGDEPQAYMDDADNHLVVPLARVLHLYPYVERVLGEAREQVWCWNDELGDWEADDDEPAG
jgi:hypothetical protein